ncbi:hypothetical protein ABZS86_21395 [Streptomyces sp. NPDC005355]|uniref:hypothetical protein n=1 Tax=Streptomyces sp. NPDC005355 TaxID=3157038 RepID=UPI0033BE085D
MQLWQARMCSTTRKTSLSGRVSGLALGLVPLKSAPARATPKGLSFKAGQTSRRLTWSNATFSLQFGHSPVGVRVSMFSIVTRLRSLMGQAFHLTEPPRL